jgi:hypothetical protein
VPASESIDIGTTPKLLRNSKNLVGLSCQHSRSGGVAKIRSYSYSSSLARLFDQISAKKLVGVARSISVLLVCVLHNWTRLSGTRFCEESHQ